MASVCQQYTNVVSERIISVNVYSVTEVYTVACNYEHKWPVYFSALH